MFVKILAKAIWIFVLCLPPLGYMLGAFGASQELPQQKTQNGLEERWSKIQENSLAFDAMRPIALEHCFYLDVLKSFDPKAHIPLELRSIGWELNDKPILFSHVIHGIDDAMVLEIEKPVSCEFEWPSAISRKFNLSSISEYDRSVKQSRALLVVRFVLANGDQEKRIVWHQSFRFGVDGGEAKWMRNEKAQ